MIFVVIHQFDEQGRAHASMRDRKSLESEAMRSILLSFTAVFAASVACHQDDTNTADHKKPTPTPPTLTSIRRVQPPLDVSRPPADAVKTSSGLAYKTLVKSEAGAQPKPEDTVLARYTAWRRNGETFFTTTVRNQPIAIKLTRAAPAFSEVLPLLHRGETAMVWAPPSRAFAEGIAYEIELTDIVPAVASTTPRAHSEGTKAAIPSEDPH